MIRHAEELADSGDYRQAVDLLEQVIDAGDPPATVLAMYNDFLRLREQSTYADLMKQNPQSDGILAHAKSLRGSRQLEFLNRVLADEHPEKTRIQLQLLRFKNALDVGDNIAREDFAAIWKFSKKNGATKRIRRPLFSEVARTSNPRSIPVLQTIVASVNLPSAVTKFLQQTVRQLETMSRALGEPHPGLFAGVVPDYDTAGTPQLRQAAVSEPGQRWSKVFARS